MWYQITFSKNTEKLNLKYQKEEPSRKKSWPKLKEAYKENFLFLK